MSDDVERQKTVNCVKLPDGPDDRTTWCGRPVAGRPNVWHELGLAFLVAKHPGDDLLCTDCEAAICSALRTAATGVMPIDVGRMGDLALRAGYWVLAKNTLGGYVLPLGMDRPRPLSPDEDDELKDLRRRHEARVSPEVRHAVDKANRSHSVDVYNALDRLRGVEEAVSDVRRQLERALPKTDDSPDEDAGRSLRGVLKKISDQLREAHGELYDDQLGISERGMKLLEEAWTELRAER